MMRRATQILATVIIFLFAAACVRQIQNIENAQVNSLTGEKFSVSQVGKAIQKAGKDRGWVIKITKPGKAIGVLHVRAHMVKVNIEYTNKTYSIRYLDSTNMKYDGAGKIHGKYNDWILRLDQQIQQELIKS